MNDQKQQTITIDVYSDVVCPWCYIGEARLQRAIEQRPQLHVARRWRPFQLRPEMPREGMPWSQMVNEKFGGRARARQIFDHVARTGAAEGIHFDFERVASAPNTLDAHRLLLFAERFGRQWELAHALFAAYFSEGRDLGRTDELAAIASSAGLAEHDVREYLAGEAGVEEVHESQEVAYTYGIGGVPFYVLEERYGLSGAQPTEVFLQALDMASDEALAAGAGT